MSEPASLPKAAVLLVSSDSALVAAAQSALGPTVAVHSSVPAAAIAALEQRPFSAVLVDWDAPDGRANDLWEHLGQRFADTPAVAVVSGGIPAAVAAMRVGAGDVVQKPLEGATVRFALQAAFDAAERAASEPPPSAVSARGLLGESRPMQQIRERIGRAAPTLATVLIRGETGTGKELVARAIHEESPRRERPFVKLHCAALPDTLLESELFGYEKGAFTGASSRKPGRVEVAEGGTLFLDEIGDITPAIQVKLLRLLQDREYERLGSSETRRADVRFVAATHRDLETMVQKGEFRSDLFYRLNVVSLWTPPLRARRDDIELLSNYFCQMFAEANGKREAKLDESALTALRSQRWPGNVRQLQNFVERLVVLSEQSVITSADVQAELAQHPVFLTQATGSTAPLRNAAMTTGSAGASNVGPLSEEVRTAEKRALERALRHAKGNRSLAARLLGISRATLYSKLEEHGLS